MNKADYINKELGAEAIEISELERLLDKKKFDFHNRSQRYFLDNLNKSPEHKLELLKKNIGPEYFKNYSLFDSLLYTSPVNWESAFPDERGWYKNTGVLYYNELVEAFKVLFHEDKFKTTTNIYSTYNKITREVKGYSSEEWRNKMQRKDMDLLGKFIDMCAHYHGDDKTKKNIDDRKEQEAIKLEEERKKNPWINIEATGYQIFGWAHTNPPKDKITSEHIVEAVRKRFVNYKDVIVYSVLAASYNSDMGSGIKCMMRCSAIKKESIEN